MAGAWAREEGQIFVSAGGNLLLSEGAQLPVHYDPTLYLEYGLSSGVTIGLDYHTADKGRIDAGVIFARFPFGQTDGADHFAASFGFGARKEDGTPRETLAQLGLYWGRGFEAGWFSIDYTATYGDIDQMTRSKADFTWGQNLDDRWTAFLQMQTGEGVGGDFYAKINPAIVFRINAQHRVSLGAVKALTGDGGSALKLNIWSAF